MAAEGLGELVDVTSEPVLKPFVVKMTGGCSFGPVVSQYGCVTFSVGGGFDALHTPSQWCLGLVAAVQQSC